MSALLSESAHPFSRETGEGGPAKPGRMRVRAAWPNLANSHRGFTSCALSFYRRAFLQAVMRGKTPHPTPLRGATFSRVAGEGFSQGNSHG